MKNFSLLPLLAIVIAVAGSAFANKQQLTSPTLQVYEYIGTTVDDQDDPNQYILLDETPEKTCGGADVICRVWAEPGSGNHPDFSSGNPLDNPNDFQVISERSL